MEVKKMEPGRKKPEYKEQWISPEFAAAMGGGRNKRGKKQT